MHPCYSTFPRVLRRRRFAAVAALVLPCVLLLWRPVLSAAPAHSPGGPLKVRVSWGHRAPSAKTFHVEVRGRSLSIARQIGVNLEADDSLRDGTAQSHAGGGDVDGVECMLEYAPAELGEIKNLNAMWRDLIAQSDPDTARRLRADPAYRRDDRRLTVQLDRDGSPRLLADGRSTDHESLLLDSRTGCLRGRG